MKFNNNSSVPDQIKVIWLKFIFCDDITIHKQSDKLNIPE